MAKNQSLVGYSGCTDDRIQSFNGGEQYDRQTSYTQFVKDVRSGSVVSIDRQTGVSVACVQAATAFKP